MYTPLAEKMRPKSLDDFIGQEHLVGKKGPINQMLKNKKIFSMIFWGPPGCGKTTLAKLIAKNLEANFISFSAVSGEGVTEIRKIIQKAKDDIGLFQKLTILFVDEIHHFNKSQQNIFLPFIEEGTIILIATTTENPGFEIIPPLLSRTQTYVFYPLNDGEIKKIIQRALQFFPKYKIDKKAIDFLVSLSNGDARFVINTIEIATNISKNINLEVIKQAIQQKPAYYDKKGDGHYDTISAFIKSMRGGDPDATLHYLARMIKAGEDPLFIARRMVIFASEDIGNAQPTALVLATSCMQAVHMIGMPEASLILAQTATYLATAKKSIASSVGIWEALADLEKINPDPIPLHLRNPENKLTKNLGYGAGHIRYPWLVEKQTGKKINQQYLPNNLKGKKYYKIDWK
ncbi:MAG: replication-associated recombination protein A [Microgenomates group bacterium]